ncbi:MAG TPA: AAA family ATPase [Candidatus Limnocylindrales bacterium]
MSAWTCHAKIAFVGSHGIRKTTAAHAFASVIQRAGHSVEYLREVIRDNPLGINEAATGEAQLWVLVTQVGRELELAPKADVLVTDRGVMDNYAYYLRACGGMDRFAVEPLLARWAETYQMVVRLTPDIALAADGIRSTNDAFRDEVEAILDEVLPRLVPAPRLLTVPASAVVGSYDWWPVAERLAASIGEQLTRERRVPRPRARPAGPEAGDGSGQLELALGGPSDRAREATAGERAQSRRTPDRPALPPDS